MSARGCRHVLAAACVLALGACAPQPAGTGAAGGTTATPAAATTTGPAASAQGPAVEDSTEMVATASFPDSAGRDIALLTDVEVGHHAGGDQVVWTFDGPAPAYRVAYVGRPIVEDGSGAPVDVRGDAVLQIILTPASGSELSGEHVRTIYDGPERIDGGDAGASTVQEVVLTGDFEATMSWAIGSDRQAPFRVTALTDPTRIVVELTGG